MPPLATMSWASIVVAGMFSGTISLGVALIALLIIVIAGYFATRYKLAELAQAQTKVATESAAEWRDNYMAERARADDLEKRYMEQRALKHEALAKVAALELKTDQTAVLRALETQGNALTAFHADFLQREKEASEIRQHVVETEERIIEQLAGMTQALGDLSRSQRL